METQFPFKQVYNWYVKNGRHDLPWRQYDYDKKTLSYRVWLAETLLQQTQVDRVKNYFENIIKTFSNIEALAATSYEEFFPYYKWLWYYSRARNMLEAAKSVTYTYDWVFPKTSEELKKIKWVWPYTAEAIKAFAYNETTLSFDTNLEKIFSRYYFWNKNQKLTKNEKQEILSDFKKSWISGRNINNALMDFGALISQNSISKIDWDKYPLTTCKFYRTQGKLEPIKQKKSSSFPSKKAYVLTILHENHKVYFSETKKFSIFQVWKNSWDVRAMIKKFFLEKYKLDVSVRPPALKSYKHESPYIICYAQTQSWIHNFFSHSWLKVKGYEEWYIEKIDF